MIKTFGVSELLSTKIPFVQILLAVKLTVTTSLSFFLVIFFFKFLGLLIITSSFIFNGNTTTGLREVSGFSNLLSNFSTYGLLSQILTYKQYTIICYLIFVLAAYTICLIISIYSNIKKEKGYLSSQVGKIKIKILSVLFHLFIILHQHLLEFLSFVFYIQFTNTLDIKKSPSNDLFTYFIDNNLNKTQNIVLIFFNLFSIIFINIFHFYAFNLLNEPFFSSNSAIKSKIKKNSIIFSFFISNLICFHFIEFFLTESTIILTKSILYGVINSFSIFIFINTYRSFNFENVLNYFINFLLSFSFFSSIIEVILTVIDGNNYKNYHVELAFLLKFLISITFLVLYYKISEKLFLKKCKTTLFRVYDFEVNTNEYENLHFLLNLMIGKEELKNNYSLIKIIFSHKKDCELDYCKCNLINNFKNKTLTSDINFIVETIFAKLNLNSDKNVTFLFSEYLFKIKKCTLLSYMMINKYINKSLRSASTIEIYQTFLLSSYPTNDYSHVLSKNIELQTFNSVFSNVNIQKNFNKKFLSFIENYEIFIRFKENFDGSLKIHSDKSDSSDFNLDSHIFESLPEIIKCCQKYHKFYKNIKSSFKEKFVNKKCKSIELSYKIYLFFFLFNKKIPKFIFNSIFLDSLYEAGSSQNYFNLMFKKYFGNPCVTNDINSSSLNIIVEISNSFKIKYFSNRLSQIFGYDHKKLIGDDIHVIFPMQLRDNHRRAFLDYFLIKKQSYLNKNTFAFCADNHILPINLKVSTLPILKKNLCAIASINIIENPNQKVFYFILSEDFELIALSKTFESVYCLNFELMRKLNLDVLKLFNITEQVKTKFKSTVENLERINNYKKKDNLYSLNDYLFFSNPSGELATSNLNSKHHMLNSKNTRVGNPNYGIGISQEINSKFSKNFIVKNDSRVSQILQDYSPNLRNNQNFQNNVDNTSLSITGGNNLNNLKSSMRLDTPNQLSNLSRADMLPQKNNSKFNEKENNKNKEFLKREYTEHAQHKKEKLNNLSTANKCIHEFTAVRDRRIIIDYLEKIKSKSIDLDLDDKINLKIEKALELANNNYNLTQKNTNKKKSQLNDRMKIKVQLRKMNDTPFYVISVKEKNINLKTSKYSDIDDVSYKKSKFIENDDRLQEDNSETNFIGPIHVSEDSKLITDKPSGYAQIRNKVMNCSGEEKINSYEFDKNPIVNPKLKSQITNSQDKSIIQIFKEDKRLKSQEKFKHRLFIILFLLMVINIVFFSVIFYLKENAIQIETSIFQISYWNNLRETSLTYLHSSIISFMLTLNKLSEFELVHSSQGNSKYKLSQTDLQILISERVNSHRFYFARFADNIKNSEYKFSKLENIYYSTEKFNKNILSWENIEYNDTLLSISNYLTFNSKLLTLEQNFTDLNYDIENYILFKNYENSEGDLQHSEHSSLMYFFNKNFETLEKINHNIRSSLQEVAAEFNNYWMTLIIICEVINILITFILLILTFVIISQYDKTIFIFILSMFLNLKKGKKIPHKSYYECQNIKSKINNFKNLIVNFNKETIKKSIDNIMIFDNPKNDQEYESNEMQNYYKKTKVENGELFDEKKLVQKDDFLQNYNENILSQNNSYNLSQNNSQNFYQNLSQNYSQNLSQNNSQNLSQNFSVNINSTLVGLNNNKKGNIYIPEKLEIQKNQSSTLNQNRKGQRKRQENKKLENNFITNSQVLKRTKHHQVKFIKNLKISIISIFIIYILLLLCNLFASILIFSQIPENVLMSSRFMDRYPEIISLFNIIRLMIIESDQQKINSYKSKISEIETNHDQLEILINSNTGGNSLEKTYEFSKMLNLNDTSSVNSTLEGYNFCEGMNINTTICEISLKNKLNSNGIDLSVESVLHVLDNIYKDYIKLKNDSQSTSEINAYPVNFLKSRAVIEKYFLNDEFKNINLQIEYIYEGVNSKTHEYILDDMKVFFDFIFNFNFLLGIFLIVFSLLIIVYISILLFSKFKKFLEQITYSSKKINNALFSIL